MTPQQRTIQPHGISGRIVNLWFYEMPPPKTKEEKNPDGFHFYEDLDSSLSFPQASQRNRAGLLGQTEKFILTLSPSTLCFRKLPCISGNSMYESHRTQNSLGSHQITTGRKIKALQPPCNNSWKHMSSSWIKYCTESHEVANIWLIRALKGAISCGSTKAVFILLVLKVA